MSAGRAYTVRSADWGDLKALKELWLACFHDDESYVDNFFARRFHRCLTLVCLKNGVLAGAAYLFPAEMWEGGRKREVLFGYAGGVLPAYRRSGVLSALHEVIYRFCDEQDKTFVINPANSALAEYFARMGMRETVFKKRAGFLPSGTGKAEIKALEASEYTALRNARFRRDGFFEWDEASVAYALEENSLCGGVSGKFEINGVPCAFIGSVSGDTLLIRELTAPEELTEKALTMLCNHYGAERVFADLPELSPFDGERAMVGMSYGPAPPKGAYLNLYWE